MEDFLNSKLIEESTLSKKAKDFLLANNFKYIDELFDTTYDDLYVLKDSNVKIVIEIIKFIKNYDVNNISEQISFNLSNEEMKNTNKQVNDLKNNSTINLTDQYNNLAIYLDDLIKENGIILRDTIDFSNYNMDIVVNYLLKKHSIVVNDKYIFKKGFAKDYMSVYLYIKKVVEIDESNIKQIVSEFNSMFNLKYKPDSSFMTLVRASGIRIDKGKFISNKVKPIISDDVLEEIKNIINNEQYVYTNSIYEKFKDRIENCYSYNHLYSYLKEKFSDLYYFGGSNMMITTDKDNTNRLSLVSNYLSVCNEPVSEQELLRLIEAGYTELARISTQNDDIVKMNDKYYLKSKFKFTDNDKLLINNYLIKISDSFNMFDLFYYLAQKDCDLLTTNYITDEKTLIILLDYMKIDELDKFEKDGLFYKRKSFKIEYDDFFEI